MASTPSPIYLRAREIHRPDGILPIGRSTFYAWLAEGRLPPGKRLGVRVRVWAQADLLALMEA